VDALSQEKLNSKVIDEVRKIVWPRNLKLFTAGPVACFPEVLEVMKFQMFSHRSKEYRELHKDTVERLARFVEASEGTVLLFPSSGTGVMEASVRNFVSLGGAVLTTIIGEFGSRYREVVESNGRRAVVLEKNAGEPVFPDELDEALRKHPEVEAVSITYNETSTGVLNPLKELAEVAKKHGKLVFVDAVSAMGAAEIKFDAWGLDVVFTSSQKAFGVPPGLAVGVFSKEALKKAEAIPSRGWYFDVLKYLHYQEKEWSTPSTPPIPQIIGLNVMLRVVDEMGGKSAWLSMYSERAKMVRDGVTRLGLELFARRGYESPTITSVKSPEGIDGYEVYSRVRERGYEIAAGYGKFKKTSFRIGHMGYMPKEYIEEVLGVIKEVLAELGWVGKK
jgi:aspartate aminotransferase-like enzyme